MASKRRIRRPSKREAIDHSKMTRPQSVRVDLDKDNRPKAKPGSGNDLIQRGIAERSFV